LPSRDRTAVTRLVEQGFSVKNPGWQLELDTSMKYETCRSLLQKLDTLRSNDLRNLANNFVLGTNVDIGETTANYGFLPVAKNEEAEDILVNVRRGEWLTMVPELPFINQVSKKTRKIIKPLGNEVYHAAAVYMGVSACHKSFVVYREIFESKMLPACIFEYTALQLWGGGIAPCFAPFRDENGKKTGFTQDVLTKHPTALAIRKLFRDAETDLTFISLSQELFLRVAVAFGGQGVGSLP